MQSDYLLNYKRSSSLLNFVWSRYGSTLFASYHNKKSNAYYLRKYLIPKTGQSKEQIELNHELEIQLPFKINNFTTFQNENQIVGSSTHRNFLFDIRTNSDVKIFQKFDQDEQEFQVQFNDENMLVFINNKSYKIYVLDIRKEQNPIFKLELNNKIEKFVFNPFNKQDFVMLFSNCFIRMNTQNSKFVNYTF